MVSVETERMDEDGKKRKRSSRSRSPRFTDPSSTDNANMREDHHDQASGPAADLSAGAASKQKEADLLAKFRTGGVYIPPARLRQL